MLLLNLKRKTLLQRNLIHKVKQSRCQLFSRGEVKKDAIK